MQTAAKIDSNPHFKRITGSAGQNLMLLKYIFTIIPRVQILLKKWEKEALKCRDGNLRKQALASLKNKAFHCQGGAVFALLVPDHKVRKKIIRLIVAYQTICDYLDNLCDRAGNTDDDAFRMLHTALFDALEEKKTYADYYKYYPYKDDGGYLKKLVDECRESIAFLPSYNQVKQDLLKLAEWYAELQIRKHVDLKIRENMLKNWVYTWLPSYPELKWQEFAAATGSTLGVFSLFVLAADPKVDREQVKRAEEAYFPWICGLHILLDYFIDQEEDYEGGDLNFTFYYDDEKEMEERLMLFIEKAYDKASTLAPALFNQMVTDGLLAMYLSDHKVSALQYKNIAENLLQAGGMRAEKTYRLCSLVRRFI